MTVSVAPQSDPDEDGPSSPVVPEEKPQIRFQRWLRRGKLGPAFWTAASVISLLVCIVLLALVIGLARELFALRDLVATRLVGGLHANFIKMDDAHITTTILVSDTIQVNDTIPVVFDVPLKKNTTVTLNKDTPISNTIIYLNGSPVPIDLILPKGTDLNIHLDISVPVSQTIPVVLDVPVHMEVPVDIPLNETELHEAFVGLRTTVEPYHFLFQNLPASWEESPFCGPLTGWLCDWFFISR